MPLGNIQINIFQTLEFAVKKVQAAHLEGIFQGGCGSLIIHVGIPEG
jgi:hypothetical protein